MAISRPASATNVAGATLTSPTGAIDDIIHWFAFRSTAATIPTKPSGPLLLGSSSGSTCAWIEACEQATSTAGVSRTFTGATQMLCRRYAGAFGFGNKNYPAIASSNIMAYGAVTAIQSTKSWMLGSAAHRTATGASVNVPPTGLSTITGGLVGSAPAAAAFDSNGISGNFTAANVTVSATSGRVSNIIELLGLNSTWNPFDLGPSTTLSNSNLTATLTATPAQANNTRGSFSRNAGKRVFAIKVNTITAGLTLANAATVLSGFASSTGTSIFILGGVLSYEIVGVGPTTLGDGTPYGVNTNLFLAVDIPNSLFWFGFNAGSGMVWNRDVTANPDTGAGGISFSGFTGPFFPMFNGGVSGDAGIYDPAAVGHGLSTFIGWDAGGAVTNVSCTKAVTVTGTLHRQTGKPLKKAVAVTGTLHRQTGKPLKKAVTVTGTLRRQTAKALSKAINATATAIEHKTTALALSRSTTPKATLTRQTGKPLRRSTTPASTTHRQTAKPLTRAATVTGRLSRSTGKNLAKAVSATATLTLAKVKLLLLTHATQPAATLSRRVAKSLTASTGPVARLRRLTSKAFAVATSPTATSTRLKVKTVAAAVSTTPKATLSRQIGLTRRARAATAATLRRSVGKGLSAATRPVAFLRRGTAKTLRAQTAPIATARANRAFQVIARVAVHSIATLVLSTGKGIIATPRLLGTAFVAALGGLLGITSLGGGMGPTALGGQKDETDLGGAKGPTDLGGTVDE